MLVFIKLYIDDIIQLYSLFNDFGVSDQKDIIRGICKLVEPMDNNFSTKIISDILSNIVLFHIV